MYYASVILAVYTSYHGTLLFSSDREGEFLVYYHLETDHLCFFLH